MPGNFDFDAEADEGIFSKPEERAAGDPGALVDFEDEDSVPMIVLSLTPEGFVQSSVDALELAHEPLQVDWRSLVCLAGPCRWYTEQLRPIEVGEPEVEVSRWCGRLRTWAEQTRLDEARIYGCSAFDPSGEFTDEVQAALAQNAAEMANIRREAAEQKAQLGICVAGPCEHFVEVVRHPMVTNEDIDRESLRFCDHLGGLGRLYDVRERPVYACTAFKPRGTGPLVSAANTKNQRALQAFRNRMAGRPEGESHGTDRRDRDWSALGADTTAGDGAGEQAGGGEADAGERG
jgi:hypothetical protein